MPPILVMQMHIESRKKKRLRQAANASIEELVSMGFPREAGIVFVKFIYPDLTSGP